MTFLPEMRTALRTYHPVPSLQKADANLQDAPRIKNILKACSLKNEATTNMPVTPGELCTRAATGIVPSTSIVNLFFVLSNHFTAVAREHFGRLEIDFLDLFLPVKFSSPSRARAFLWLAFHYHEAPSTNPFDGLHARQRLVPELAPLTDEEFELENVDPEDERDYAKKMTKLRIEFLAKNARASESQNPQGKKSGGKSKGRALSPERSVLAKRERSDPDSSPEDGNVEDADLLGRPTQRRKPNPSKSFKVSRVISESLASRASVRQSNIVHRSILQQAWHVVTTVDAFLDSDEEDIDESSRHAYTMRLQVLNDFHQNINTPIRPRQLPRAS
jgi:Ino eighty subunit 1